MARGFSSDHQEDILRETAEAAQVRYMEDRTPGNRAVWLAALKALTNQIYRVKTPAA
jgi:hypothetical protein